MKRLYLSCLTACVLVSVAALADPPTPQGMDVDSMIEKYKNMPGGDQIVKQLQAHRAQIEAAQKKAAAAQGSQHVKDAQARAASARQSMAAIAPKSVKQTGEILAMIPAPPARIAEARARLGKTLDDHGTRKDDGDVKSDPAQQALFDIARRRIAETLAGAPASPGRALGEEQGKAIRALNDQAMKSNSASHQWQGEATQASNEAKSVLQKTLDGIETELHQKIVLVCVEAGEGVQPTAAQIAQCKSLIALRNSRREAARQAYLDKLGPVASRLRDRLKGMIADDQKAAGRVDQAFGGMQNAPGGGTFAQMMEGNEAVLLQQLIALNSASVIDASVKDPAF